MYTGYAGQMGERVTKGAMGGGGLSLVKLFLKYRIKKQT